MTIAVKIILIEDETDPRTPAVELNYVHASTRTPTEIPAGHLNPSQRETILHVTSTRDIRISALHFGRASGSESEKQ